MANYMKNRLETRPSIITAKTGDRVLKPRAVASYKFRTKQHGDSVLLQNLAGKEHIHLRSTVDCFVDPFPHKLTRQLKAFGKLGNVNLLQELYHDSDVGVDQIANDLLGQDLHFMDKYIGSCSALLALQEIDNARTQQYMDLPHPMYLCCLPNKHVALPGSGISTYQYKMLHNPYSMRLPKESYCQFVNTFCKEKIETYNQLWQ